MSSNQFNGLMMPVFTAFGWAGEEKALDFALDQMELFINTLYLQLTREVQAQFPSYGLDRPGQSAYLATNQEPTKELYIAYNARPMSLETSLAISEKVALAKAYNSADRQPDMFYSLLIGLGSDWILRIQQMEYDEDTGGSTHYQDLYKDSIGALGPDSLATIIARAAFLNSETQWVVPILISHRASSDKISAMHRAVIPNKTEEINRLIPLIGFLTGKVKKTKRRKKASVKPKAAADITLTQRPQDPSVDKFTYISDLKPLHIRRGFINMTPQHWPFFAINARSETRPVSMKYGEKTDDKCAVWRLVPNDQARIVLSPAAHQWLEDSFDPDDRILITAIKREDNDILITLEPVE